MKDSFNKALAKLVSKAERKYYNLNLEEIITYNFHLIQKVVI